MRAYELNVHLVYRFQPFNTLNARDLFMSMLESFYVLLMLTDLPPIDCSSGSERITIESERMDSNELLEVQKRKV